MSDVLQIRPFQNDDLDAVTALWEETVADPKPWNEPRGAILRKLVVGDGLFLVGDRNGRIVATVIAGYDGVRGWIYRVAVLPSEQRTGLGRQMLQAAEAALAERGCRKINLQVRHSNQGVIAFYERCGYGVDDVVSMGKPLPVPGGAIDPVPTLRISDEISLSPFVDADRPSLVQHLNVTDEFSRHMATMPHPYTDLHAEQWLTMISTRSLRVSHTRTWAVRQNGQLVGAIGFRDMSVGERAEVGYWIAKPLWGRGLMSGIVRALSDFAFSHYDLRRIYAGAFTINPASCRVLEKAGFTREGVRRQHFFRNGEAFDVALYAKLRDESTTTGASR